jgi:hypothetical protein
VVPTLAKKTNTPQGWGADLLDLMELRFEPVHVPFLIFEQLDE